MSTLIILATPDGELAKEWELQAPPNVATLHIASEDLPQAAKVGLGAVLVLDAVMERLFLAKDERVCAIFIGEPRSVPFEQARISKRYRLCLSYDESRQRLRELLPLVVEIAEKQSVVDLIASRGRKSDSGRSDMKRVYPAFGEVWDFLEGAVESIDSRERLIGEFRRASRYILRASHAVFFFREADGFRADRGTSYFPANDALVSFFETNPAVIDGSFDGLPADPIAELAVRNRMALWGARMLVPVHDNAKLLGVIALGVREDGQNYDEQDKVRAIHFARLLRNLIAKCTQLGRLNSLASQVALGARYFPSTLVLGSDDGVPRHVPLVVRDLLGQVRRTRELVRVSPCTGQPFRASAGIVAETGGVWAYWEEASGEVHDARMRERSSRRDLLRELALTLSHELGNALVSLATFRQLKGGKLPPEHMLEAIKKDISYLEGLNRNLELMQRFHESEPSAIDIREVVQAIGQELGVRVEVGPDPIMLTASRQLLEYALASLIRTLGENRPREGVENLSMKLRSTGVGAETTGLVSINGRSLELEGVLPEPVADAVPNHGRLGVFLAKEILRLHNGEIHAGPGIEGTEILVSFRSW